MWLDDAVVYQVYLRSFQDSDGDGVGDLPGVTARLGHIAELGASAVWLSPIYRSPNADFGYDVSDFLSPDPSFGTLEDLDELVKRAHGLGLRVLLDFVPCHTSIEHAWFRERPEYYFWADSPPNNWLAAFGGTAWALDPSSGRYYLHSFFPEQADLNWRNPHVPREMTAAMRFWLDRGVDGFRLDALDRLLKDEQLRDDPPATGPPPLPLHPEYGTLLHSHSMNAPDIGTGLRAIREAVGDAALVGEVYLPASELAPYVEVLDATFAFEVLHAGGSAEAVRRAIASALAAGKYGWVLSNHDFSRLGSRVGQSNIGAATVLLLALPGPAFIFQGDELGLVDEPTEGRQLDRHGRDAFRRPMPWDASPNGGFTSGVPWLPVARPLTGSVAEQEQDSGSQLNLVRDLIRLRRELSHGTVPGAAGPSMEVLDSSPDTVVVKRGTYVIAANFGDEPRPAPAPAPATAPDSDAPASSPSTLIFEAHPGDGSNLSKIPPHGAWIARA
jgi:alpha-glucosidase